ncbi:MAG: hypothetical protein JOZ21_07190, partial [Verrucomicrobia bacterium]|nr:hypothetical protein [Verrucomicrobiota bacterium]
AREEDGLYFVKKETKDINEILGQFLTAPAYLYVSQVAGTQTTGSTDDASTKKEPTDPETLTVIRENLGKIADAKDKALKARRQNKIQSLTLADVQKYLIPWPESVAGETYEIGGIGEPPYAIAPVDIGDIPAGTRITP